MRALISALLATILLASGCGTSSKSDPSPSQTQQAAVTTTSPDRQLSLPESTVPLPSSTVEFPSLGNDFSSEPEGSPSTERSDRAGHPSLGCDVATLCLEASAKHVLARCDQHKLSRQGKHASRQLMRLIQGGIDVD